MSGIEEIKSLLEDLTGQKAPISVCFAEITDPFKVSGIGYSQFNELLLIFGFDRISKSFFQYLKDGTTEFTNETVIESLDELKKGIYRFRVLAIFRFGNIRYAFKTLSKEDEEESLRNWISSIKPLGKKHFQDRHNPIMKIGKIKDEDTYFVGYLIDKDLEDLKKKSVGEEFAKIEKRKEEIRSIGSYNFNYYLSSDHLDVYVATSMRKRHEYIFTASTINKIFHYDELKELNLRWFDPTRVYSKSRIDKGLLEGLMLKRAKCTVYLIQESDTFGKDSELASTLAQGKPVIAYVPEGNKSEVDTLIQELCRIYEQREIEVVLSQLQLFNPSLAWNDKEFRHRLEDPSSDNIDYFKDLLYKSVKTHYDNRADNIKDLHPLGIQVNIDTGVANGVLVVRTEEDCVKLLKAILTGEDLEFYIHCDENECIQLKETISDSIFRVVTNDEMLTNSFWNFYPYSSEKLKFKL